MASSDNISYLSNFHQNLENDEMTGGTNISSLPVYDAHKESVGVGRNDEYNDKKQSYSHKSHLCEYKGWDNMKQRCRTKGYVLDPRFKKFADFMHYMGEKPAPEYSIDRKDPTNPEYSPENCQWASKKQQTANRAYTRMLTDKSGQCLPVAEWSRRTGIKGATILSRIDRLSWSTHEAIHLPINHKRQNSGANDLPLANMDELETLYVNKLTEEHQQGFVPILAKDKKMLREIARHLEVGGLPSLPALAVVLDNWSGFTEYADKVYGKFKPPRVPTPEYLYRALSAIGNYYLLHLNQIEEAKAKQQHQALNEKQQYARQQQAKHRREFIDAYLNANPEYKQQKERLTWLESVKDQPNYGMERQHFIEYAQNWVNHFQPTDGVGEQESPEQRIELAMADTTRWWHQRIWQLLMIDTEDELQTLLREKGLQKQAEEAWGKTYK
jgi:hypothetical protein